MSCRKTAIGTPPCRLMGIRCIGFGVSGSAGIGVSGSAEIGVSNAAEFSRVRRHPPRLSGFNPLRA